MAANLAGYQDDGDGALSDINVTPLVDVILVLLIVFMITVPAIVGSARVKVDLPETTAAQAESDLLPFIFSLKQGEGGKPVLYLNENPITEQGVRDLFQGGGALNEQQQVSLAADKGIPYGDVVKVLDLFESLGLKKLSLNTRHVPGR
jgi:biopolymer transport protein ExbD